MYAVNLTSDVSTFSSALGIPIFSREIKCQKSLRHLYFKIIHLLHVAENEPDIDSYFVRPPYFDEVAVRGQACRSLVLFGARGAGKSATRLTFYKGCWALRQKDEPAPLAVALGLLADHFRWACKRRSRKICRRGWTERSRRCFFGCPP